MKIKRNLSIIFQMAAIILFINSCKPEEDLSPLQPIITKISPESGFAGTTLSISGKGFATEAVKNVVKINSIKVNVQEVQGDTLLKVVVPENASTGAVQVFVNDQLANGPLFTVPRNANPPVITSITPASVEVGDLITITGSNFKTGAELDQNTVRISGLRVKVVSGTATELNVRVPGVPKQPSVSVTVAVQGTPSNALPLQVNGFEGKLVWMSSPQRYNSKIFYKVVANADGSSLVRDERAMANQDFFVSSRYATQPYKFAYNPGSTTTYFYANRQVFDPLKGTTYFLEIWQADAALSDIKKAYSFDPSDPRYSGSGQFNFMIPSGDGDGFYYVNDKYEIYEGFKDGGSDLTLRRKMIPGDFGNPVSTIFQFDAKPTSGSISATGSKGIWVNGYLVSPTMTQPSIKLNQERNPSSICYNPLDRNFYFSGYLNNSDFLRGVVGIYRVAENGGTPEKLAEISADPAQGNLLIPRFLQVLNTPTGVKLFWVSDSVGSPGQSVWFLNLKGQPPYSPVLLYDKPEQISFDPDTYPVFSNPSNFVSLFYVTSN